MKRRGKRERGGGQRDFVGWVKRVVQLVLEVSTKALE